MASDFPRRPGLWVEIALTLALITLATILLNAGVFWLLIKTTESERRTSLAESVAAAVVVQLEAGGSLEKDPTRKLLATIANRGFDIDELWVVDATLNAVANPVGEPPSTADAGLREALYGRTTHLQLDGDLFGTRSVVVTAPVSPSGRVLGALRLRMPMKGTPLPGGPAAFVFTYTVFSGIAIALFGLSLFQRRLIQPIRSLMTGTAEIAAGEFGTVVSVDAARELQELSAALSTMSASLASYRRRTAEQVEALEEANHGLRDAQEALVRTEKLAGVGRLAAGLAHEVGNPLAAVLGYVELLRSGLDDPALEADLLARSERELTRIHGILQQLLGYARTGSGRPTAVPLHAATTDAVETVRHQRLFRSLELRVTDGRSLPPAFVEKDKLHQVLVNLLLNAAEALRDQPAGRIDAILLQAEEGSVAVEVRDNGHGFGPTALDRALEPFFTTRDVGEGTGLGLSTCREIVQASGGSIALGNRPEGGAWVRVSLPVAEDIGS